MSGIFLNSKYYSDDSELQNSRYRKFKNEKHFRFEYRYFRWVSFKWNFSRSGESRTIFLLFIVVNPGPEAQACASGAVASATAQLALPLRAELAAFLRPLDKDLNNICYMLSSKSGRCQHVRKWLWRARSRLCRGRFLKVNFRFVGSLRSTWFAHYCTAAISQKSQK